MKADQKTEATVMAVLNAWCDGYVARDMERLVALFAPDPDVLLIGTGADEGRVGLADIKGLFERDWSQSHPSSMELGWHSVSVAGSVAWVASDATVHAKVEGQEIHLPARMTAVLERRGDEWLVLQLHGSLPAAGQAEGEAWPT